MKKMFRRLSFLLAASMAAALTAQAQSVVFHNIAPYDPGALTSGNFIGGSLIMGNQALDFKSLVFPQQNDTVDEYVSNEQFSIATRNPDGTVGATLYDTTHFTLTNDSSNGQTTVSADVPLRLLPATGYWFVLNEPADALETEWAFSASTGYQSNYGITIPANDASYAQYTGDDPAYFNLADGPQMFDLFSSPTNVPELSTWALLGLGGAAGCINATRRHQQRARPA